MRRLIARLTLPVALILVMTVSNPALASPPDPTSRGVNGLDRAKSHLVQDRAQEALKHARAVQLARSAPRDPVLNTIVTQYVIEPEGVDSDDHGTSYTDGNYWLFCTAGAVAASMYYWNSTNVTNWPAGSFTEPVYASIRKTTYWTNTDSDAKTPYYYTQGRNYIMYIAEQVNPPSYVDPGEVNFHGSVGGTLADMRDAMNWEASGHAGNWSGYFYYVVTQPYLTQSALHADIVSDIYYYGKPVLVITMTSGLSPNWSNGGVLHAVSVIGYDDSAGTYTYIDTCGVRCGASHNGGVYTVNQTTLYNGIHANAYGGIVY